MPFSYDSPRATFLRGQGQEQGQLAAVEETHIASRALAETKLFRMKSVARVGKCLGYDLNDSSKNAYFYTCNEAHDTQLWIYDSDSKQIKSFYNKEWCLDMKSDGSKDIYVYYCHDGDNQKFSRNNEGLKSEWTISYAGEHLCMDIAPGIASNVIAHPCNGGLNQHFNNIFLDYQIIQTKTLAKASAPALAI